MGEMVGYIVIGVGLVALAAVAIPLLLSFTDEVILHPEHTMRHMNASEFRRFMDDWSRRHTDPIPSHWIAELPPETVADFCGMGLTRHMYTELRSKHPEMTDDEFDAAFQIQIRNPEPCRYRVQPLAAA